MLKMCSFNKTEASSSTGNSKADLFGSNLATECIPYDRLNGESRAHHFGWGEGRKVAKSSVFSPLLLYDHDFVLEAWIVSYNKS